MQIVHTDKKDFTLSNLRKMIADGNIIPDPDYQRSYVFDDGKASRLIESILIGIPIPTVYLSQEEDEWRDKRSFDIICPKLVAYFGQGVLK